MSPLHDPSALLLTTSLLQLCLGHHTQASGSKPHTGAAGEATYSLVVQEKHRNPAVQLITVFRDTTLSLHTIVSGQFFHLLRA